jgi:acyl-coenzyme A thioesterase PaaI-like protein
MNLIIRDELSAPPSWFASFRDLTLYCSIFLHVDIVIESDDVDSYYRWLKPKGGMDFVSDFVRTGSERGFRIDTRVRRSRSETATVVVPRIIPENVSRLIAVVKTSCL